MNVYINLWSKKYGIYWFDMIVGRLGRFVFTVMMSLNNVREKKNLTLFLQGDVTNNRFKKHGRIQLYQRLTGQHLWPWQYLFHPPWHESDDMHYHFHRLFFDPCGHLCCLFSGMYVMTSIELINCLCHVSAVQSLCKGSWSSGKNFLIFKKKSFL